MLPRPTRVFRAALWPREERPHHPTPHGLTPTPTLTPNPNRYNNKCDMWSLGCLLYELCTYRPPFEAGSMEALARTILRGKYEQIPSMYSKGLRDAVARSLPSAP